MTQQAVFFSGEMLVAASGEADTEIKRRSSGVSQLVGTWVRGDTGKPLVYTVLQNGSAMDISGITGFPTLSLVRLASGSDVTLTINGTTGIGTDGLCTFVFGTNTFAQPASRLAPDIYEARITFTMAGLVYYTDPFRIGITKFP